MCVCQYSCAAEGEGEREKKKEKIKESRKAVTRLEHHLLLIRFFDI